MNSVWVTNETLQEYDPNYDYAAECEVFEQPDVQKHDSEEIRDEKLRRMAFKVEAPDLNDHSYWHNYILSESEVRRLQRKRNRQYSEDSDDAEIASAKRRSQSSSTSPEYGGEWYGRTTRSSNARSTQLPTPKTTPKTTPNGKQVSTEIIEISDQEESDEEDSIIVVRPSTKLDHSTKGSVEGHSKIVRARPSSKGMSPPQMT